MKQEDNNSIEDGLPQTTEAEDDSSSSKGTTKSTPGDRRWALIGLVTIVVLVGVFAATIPLWKNGNDNETPNATISDDTDNGDETDSNDSPDTHDSPDTPGSNDNTEPPPLYTSTGGPFNVTLNLFGNRILSAPSSASENEAALDEGVTNAARFLLNAMISGYYRSYCPTCKDDIDEVFISVPDLTEQFDDVSSTSDTGNDELNDYGTNNQEEGVEEGDLIVSDGTYVYAAYGDYLVVWNARTLEMVSSLQMPPISSLEGESTETEEETIELGSDEDLDMKPEDLFIMPSYYGDPYIQSLLLYNNRLVVIVGGYGNYYRTSTDRSSTVLNDYLATHVRVYDVSSLFDAVITEDLEPPRLVSTRDVNGRFTAIRAIGRHAHLVTTSGIDTYTDFQGPLSPWNFPDLTEEEYTAHVQQAAEEKAIPSFLTALKQELSVVTGELPLLPTICMWQTTASDGEAEEYAYPDGILQTLTQVHSFDLEDGVPMDDDDEEEVSLDVSVSGVFLPSYWSEVYAATDTLVVAGQGWDYNPTTGESKQSTYLVGMALQDATSTPHSIGVLDGYVLNSRSLDVVGNVLRVATSIQNTMWFALPEVSVETTTQQVGVETTTVEEDSTTQNYVTLLEMPGAQEDTPGEMEELGKLQLGKPNELFTAVRFFDNIAYAVTFERIDPFYVLNLDDPRNPQITAELTITGFSEYLHSMNDDNTLILALGQEADEEGQILGMKITVFDATVPENPVVAQSYSIEEDPNVYSSSPALWDFKAIRYVANQLIIPVDIYSWDEKSEIENFHGFHTYYVSELLIEPKCQIRHESAYETQCFHCGSSLAQRSMIFSGDVMTTNDHFVRLTDIDDCTEKNSLDVSVGDDDCSGSGGCYWLW